MLHVQLREDMKTALKAKDELRLSVLRGLITMCTNELTATKRTPQDTLSDDEVLAVIKRAHKQRREAAAQFEAGGRADLAAQELRETEVLTAYLPAQLDEQTIERVVREKATTLGITDASGLGKLVGAAMADLKGAADGAVVRSVAARVLKG